jgi:hypothetical protein
VAGQRRARTLSGAGGKRAVGQFLAWADSVPAAFLHLFLFLFPFSVFLFVSKTLFRNSFKSTQTNFQNFLEFKTLF